MSRDQSFSSIALIQISKGFHNVRSKGCGKPMQACLAACLTLSFTLLDTDNLLKICLDRDSFGCLGISKGQSEIRYNHFSAEALDFAHPMSPLFIYSCFPFPVNKLDYSLLFLKNIIQIKSRCRDLTLVVLTVKLTNCIVSV